MKTIKRCTAIGLAVSLALATAEAREVSPRQKMSFDIDAPSLVQALMQFTQQSGLQLMVPTGDATEAPAPKVVGSFTPTAALDQLLAGTAFRYEFANARTVAIRVADSALSSSPRANTVQQTSSADIRLAQASVPASRGGESEDGNVAPTNRHSIPEILVTGTKAKSLNMDIQRSRDDAQPYVVLDKETIARSGALNLDDFLKNNLSMNASSATAGRNNKSSINLRGLGANQTLILIDGHRAASYSTGSGTMEQPDINGIPLAAIERIEVLPTTASGIYGGGATGGAVNIVLRRDYSGVNANLGYGGSFDGGGTNRHVDVSAGWNFEEGRANLLLTGSYANSNPVLVSDRDFVERSRQWVLAHNPTSILNASAPPLGATTNIRSNTRVAGVLQNLTLKGSNAPLNSLITYVPVNYAGRASDGGAALVANAGQYNLGLADTAQIAGGAGQTMFNYPRIETGTATLRREFTPRVSAFLEIDASNNSSESVSNGASNQTFVIPASAPNNPFNQAIRVNTPALGAEQTAVSTSYSRRAVGGVIFKLFRDWQLEADYTWNRTRFYSSTPDALNSTASSAVGSGAIDVLRDTNAFAVDFSPFVGDPSVVAPTQTFLKDASVRVAGSLPWSLPAGNLSISTLFEHRDESVSDTVVTVPSQGVKSLVPGRSQSVDSIYAELLIPLVSTLNHVPAIHRLELQVAARRDEYSVTGATASINLSAPTEVTAIKNKSSATSPTFALRYQPSDDVTIRGSYGRGFLPPSVAQLVPFVPLSFPAAIFGFTDPRRGNEVVAGDNAGNLALTGGGNADLRPETSTSWSAGAVLTPRVVPGLRLSVDWTKIDKKDEITGAALFAQSDFAVEPYVPGVIIRAPVTPGDPFGVGPVVGINTGLVNIARRRMQAYDFAADYEFDPASFGRFDFSAAATRLVHLQTQVTPGAPVVENAGAIATVGQDDAGLKWKGRGTVRWSYQGIKLAWTARYFHSYWLNPAHTVVPNQGSASVPNQIYHDLSSSYAFGDRTDWGGLLSNTEIQLGVKNVFSKKPPVDVVGKTGNAAIGFGYSSWGDPLLATYFLSIRKQF